MWLETIIVTSFLIIIMIIVKNVEGSK
jgi:hypothetical protein